MINIIIILFSVSLNASAQLFLRAGMLRIGEINKTSIHDVFPIILKVATSPFILGGLACYAISVVVWMVVLSRVAVNYAYPMLSVGYIITAVFGWWLFSEPLTPIRMLGIAVIIVGVILINQ